MSFGLPGVQLPHNAEAQIPVLEEVIGVQADGELEINVPVQDEPVQEPPIQTNHTLVYYAAMHFEGGILNAPPLPSAVKEQILFATASFMEPTGRVYIHKNFYVAGLSPFEIATLYRVINSYHKFWEIAQSHGQPLYQAHLDIIEEHVLDLAWESPEIAAQIIHQLTSFRDSNLQDLIVKVSSELFQISHYTRIEHTKLLVQFAAFHFNYNGDDNFPKLLSDSVKKQIKHASYCYRNAEGGLVPHRNFKFEHLSAAETVMLYRVFNSYYRKWDSQQNASDSVFDKYIEKIENYLGDLCWSNPQKARNVRDVIAETNDRSLETLGTILDEQLDKLVGFALVPHATLLFHHLQGNYGFVSDTVKVQVGFASSCYRNDRGDILVHKNFTFDKLSPEDFAQLFRVLYSYHILFDQPQHIDPVFHKHIEMMEEYLESLCWNDVNRQRLELIRNAFIAIIDPSLHGIIQKQTSYLLNMLPYSLIDHSSKWFNYDGSNPAFELVYRPLTDNVKQQIRFAVLTDRELSGSRTVHKNFQFDHLSLEEIGQLYTTIHSYYQAYDQTYNQVYRNHLLILEKFMKNICWENPASGVELRDILLRLNNGIRTDFIDALSQTVDLLENSVPVDHARDIIAFAGAQFNFEGANEGEPLLSEAVKRDLKLATVCYTHPTKGLVIHEAFPSKDLSARDLATVFRIIKAYSITERLAFQNPLFYEHLQVLESHFEQVCLTQLDKATELRDVLVGFEDVNFKEITTKLSYYIANLASFNLIQHSEFWFNYSGSNMWYPPLSEAVKEQVRFAILYYQLDGPGSTAVLHPKFNFRELTPSDLITLYRIIKSYVDLPLQQINSDYGYHQSLMENYIERELPATDEQKAANVRDVLLKMPDDSINSMIQKLNAHPNMRYDRSMFRYLEPQNKYKTALGGGALVYLYHPDAVFKKVVPPTQGVAVKAYFMQTPDEDKLRRLFEIEVEFLKAMQGYNGVPKLLDYNADSRMIMMSAITDENGLDLIKQNPGSMKDLCVQHAQALARLHNHTTNAFALPRSLENQSNESIKDMLGKLEMNCVDHFNEILEDCPNQEIKDKIIDSAREFLTKKASEKSFFARCLNDSCIDSYFPASDIFIDFNASSNSPVERDIAAAIVNLLLKILNSGIAVDPIKKRESLISMVDAYIEEYAKDNDEFVLNLDYLRFFFAQQLLIYTNVCLADPNVLESIRKKVPERVIGLLDIDLEFTFPEMIDFILSSLVY